MADLGELRRSSLIQGFGPGAVVDFRSDGAAISVVVAGIDEWPQANPVNHPAEFIYEPRLQKVLGRSSFRLPPVALESHHGNREAYERPVPAVRFPDWLQCPLCNKIMESRFWNTDPGKAYCYCAGCTQIQPGQQRVFVVPVRFVHACEKGHVDEFPWRKWVPHEKGCNASLRKGLSLKTESQGLSGLILSCPECKARRSLDGIFGKDAWTGWKCRGKTPWLATADAKCEQTPRTLQRGASNLYFSAVVSALSIPPWNDDFMMSVGQEWDTIINIEDPAQRRFYVEMQAQNNLSYLLEQRGWSVEELITEVERRLNGLEELSDDDLLGPEYKQLIDQSVSGDEEQGDFETRVEQIPEPLKGVVERIVRVVRLREVRALKGFSRISPLGGNEGDEGASNLAPIELKRHKWLPAIEVRGEGVFVDLFRGRLLEWEQDAVMMERASKVDAAWEDEWNERENSGERPFKITPRYLLVHTFAHALMRQLTMECGYSSSALRERLYVSEGDPGMAGVLIYTATSDSDGTLGGLQRQGESSRIERTIVAAIRSMEWCSSDPLCMDGLIASGDGMSAAACHACVLSPETSCEQFNRFLDRATLVGVSEDSSGSGRGFFHDLLEDL